MGSTAAAAPSRVLDPQSQRAPCTNEETEAERITQPDITQPGHSENSASPQASHPPTRRSPPNPVSPGISRCRPGEKVVQLMVSMHVSQARNETYHYGRIRRKTLLENAVCTHAFNKVSSSELQAGQQHEATEPLPSSSHPGQRPRETRTGPGPGLAVGSKSSRLPGLAQPGCTTSRLPRATGLDWFPTSNVEIHSPGPHALWGLLSACNGWAMDLLYQTINVLLICYPLWRHNAQVTHTVRGRKPPREQASECDGGTPALRKPRGEGCWGRARPPRSPCLQGPRPPRHSSPLGWPYTRTLQPV